MKTNIDLTKDFTMGDIMSTEFFLYFKNYIKEMVEDQKIAKRDRKDVKHPCPEKRKYNTLEAYYRVLNQRWLLSELYEVYYFMKKNKDFDWSRVNFTPKKTWSGKEYLSATNFSFSDLKEYRTLQNIDSVSFSCLSDVIKKYVNDGK